MMKIAIVGAGGLLGNTAVNVFREKGYDVLAVSRKEYDIAEEPFSKFASLVEGCGYLINCSGIIKPVIKDYTSETIMKVNCIFPRNLVKLSATTGIKCIHITTDCAFSGSKGNYNELDVFDVEDMYGTSKIAGESTEIMTLRTSIIGEEKNRSRSLLEWAKSNKGQEVNGYANHFWNGVTTHYLSAVMEKIIGDNLYTKGLFHMHSPDVVSKYELLRIMSDAFHLDLKVNKADGPGFCDRSLSSVYDLSSRLVTKTIREQVEEIGALSAQNQ